MKARKTYFLVLPGTTPTVGSIVLGDVHTEPTLAQKAVNKQPFVFPPSIPITYSIPLKNWTWNKTHGSKVGGGILAQFMGLVDFTISANVERNKVQAYSCKELETHSFEISGEYWNLLKAVPEVQKKILQRERLYIVTGIKIAKGATVNEEAFKSLGFHLATSVDLTLLGGAPVKIGPQTDIERPDTERLAYDIDQDFVFAYRLEEIYFRWRTMRNHPFGKEGDLYNVPQGADVEEEEEEEEEAEDTVDNFIFADRWDGEIPASVVKGLQTCQVRDVDGEEYDVCW